MVIPKITRYFFEGCFLTGSSGGVLEVYRRSTSLDKKLELFRVSLDELEGSKENFSKKIREKEEEINSLNQKKVEAIKAYNNAVAARSAEISKQITEYSRQTQKAMQDYGSTDFERSKIEGQLMSIASCMERIGTSGIKAEICLSGISADTA